MINIADIQPDAELKRCLEGNITIQTSAADMATLPIYQQGERPNTGLADEFIDININGVIRSRTQPLGLFYGNLAVSIYCRTQNNGVVKRNRVSSIISQLEKYLKYRCHGRYFFELNPLNIITPTTINVTAGYSVTVLNVEWRMDENETIDSELENGDSLLLQDNGRLMLE